ncbi:MAG: hypothetical protein H7Z11_16005 [Verrucomicrobia bacterium]|nr:hypothetical protein [Leptolyngbya sp. ES-bin-22]
MERFSHSGATKVEHPRGVTSATAVNSPVHTRLLACGQTTVGRPLHEGAAITLSLTALLALLAPACPCLPLLDHSTTATA